MIVEKVFRNKRRTKNKAYCNDGLYAYVYLLLVTIACNLNKQMRLS